MRREHVKHKVVLEGVFLGFERASSPYMNYGFGPRFHIHDCRDCLRLRLIGLLPVHSALGAERVRDPVLVLEVFVLLVVDRIVADNRDDSTVFTGKVVAKIVVRDAELARRYR